MTETLIIDRLTFEIRRSTKRKTIGLTVDRDGELVVSAPEACPIEIIEQVAREKQLWVYDKLARKEMLRWPVRIYEFVTGENFYYLGRSYRLKLIDANNSDDNIPPLSLHEGRFLLRRDQRATAMEHFIQWYKENGLPWIEQRVQLFADRIGVYPEGIQVRNLGYRWGSCSKSEHLNFHWRTIQLPPRIIEYVIAHELVHLLEPHHKPSFWQRLERVMPDYAARKQWLAENGGQF